MRRRFLLAMVALLVAVPVVAVAQTADEVAEAVERRGYYADLDVISINEMERFAGDNPTIGFVALAADVDDADFLAEDVLDAITTRDTVIVLTPSEVGVASTVLAQDRITAALDEAFATTGDSYATDFRQLAQALAGRPDVVTPVTTTSPAVEGSGGGFSFGWIVLVGAAIVGVIVWRNSRRDRDTVERRLAQAKAEIAEQMSVIANQILELSDRVDLAENDRAEEHYRRGSDIFRQAEDRLEHATNETDLASLSDDLDDARWELEAAEAILRGDEPPPPPPEDEHPEPCFFDPTHGAGVEEATLETAAGSKTVKVCKADAERLRRGELPAPRTIRVGRKSYPAPRAPRSHGGRGMDWLDVFSVIVGGMGEAAPYRWDDRGGGGFGGFGGLGRSGSGVPKPPRRSSSGGRTSGRSPAPRPRRTITGRGRRSR